MKVAIETRELITLQAAGYTLRGTFHTTGERPDGVSSISDDLRLGILFLSPLAAPRAWNGDLAVFLADCFAARGYPSFRLDLPGLGDTAGDDPENMMDFINRGGYASIAASSVEELVRRFHLSGMVLVGHCSGAVTALYTAAEHKECKGLLLMDPYFYTTKGLTPKLRLELVDWAARNRLAAVLRVLFDRARELKRALSRNNPPRNANFPLLARWKQAVSSQLPILILKAPGLESPGSTLRPGQFPYLKHLLFLAGRRHQVSVEFVTDTDHSFANQTGRAAVLSHAEAWLSKYYPQALSGPMAVVRIADAPDQEHDIHTAFLSA